MKPTSSIKTQRWVVMGVSGCGKSEIGARLARRLGVVFVEGDAYHPRENIEKMAAGTALNDEDRREWLMTLQGQIREAAGKESGLVLSCSALKRAYRDLLRSADPNLVFVHLFGSRSVIANRMQSRSGHFMPVGLLDAQLRDLEPPAADERALHLDIESDPDQIVEQILQRFHQQERGQE